MNRNWLLGLGAAALVVLVVALAVVFGGGGGGPVEAARAFFAAIPSGGAQAAYAKSAPAFQSSTTPDAWAATVAQHNLSQYANSTWSDAGKGGDAVTLNGVLNLKGGGAQPATVQMVKGSGGWSVYSLNLPGGGVSGATGQASAGVAGSTQDASTGAPAAPSGAAPGQPYAATGPADQPPLPAPVAQGAALPQGYAPAGYPQPGQGAAPVTLIPSRISHDCGPHLLNLPGVQTIDVHCVDGMQAVPGARGHCQAIINGGQPVNVSVVVQSYDPAHDDAELDCRLY